MTPQEKIKKLQNVLVGILDQAKVQEKAGDKYCTLGKANLRCLEDALRETQHFYVQSTIGIDGKTYLY